MVKSWWIHDATLLAGSNPTNGDLLPLRAQGFSLAVSLLDEKTQLPRYDKQSVTRGGWGIYPIPIVEGETPSLVQMCEFASLMGAASKATKIFVFCDNGLGRSAFMGAVYWIAKGLSAREASSRMARNAGVERAWSAEDWHAGLRKFEALQWRIP
jgi:protein-tyrosine phosphatase